MTIADIEPEWQQACDLAWESLRHGSLPIGAVLRNSAGEIVAAGRNRRAETDIPVGQLGNTALAHAEMNVLAQLPPVPHDECTLFTTLEPCLLCTSALRLTRVGEVRFAAADPFWDGVADIPTLLRPPAARHWTRRVGPVDGPLAVFCGVLHGYWYLRNQPEVLARPRDPLVAPGLVTLAEKLDAAGMFTAPTVSAAWELGWPQLVAYKNGN
jgi:tRNA(Arg) A34 adenosine deaminase TadA